jgi:hypothetical protein
MSKLDQIKALGDAKRAARKSSDGRRDEAHPAGVPAKPQRSSEHPKAAAPGQLPRAGVASRPSEAKRGRGRPKIEGPRPWEAQGISKRTHYRRLAEQRETKK